MNRQNIPFTFCNNCGKPGHSYTNCKLPITSIGFIVYTYVNDILKYLMIRRKDSLGYVDFMRGRYNLNNIEYLQNIIDEMTLIEKDNILNKGFDELWKDLWGIHIGIQYRSEEKLSREKFNNLKAGITINNKIITLETILNNSKTDWTEPEWGFPKGRRNYQEKDLTCALREFDEETGYNKSNIKLINNLLPYEEIFIGSNYKSYKHKYFIAYMDSDIKPYTEHQATEVSRVEWMSYDQCIASIRPYNLEKKRILNILDNILKKYTIY